MFKPKRLIYREIGDLMTEGVPNALEATLNYVPKTAEKVSKEIQAVSTGVNQAVKGVLKGTGRVLDFVGKKVLWQDVGALPKEAAKGWYKNLKGMTVDAIKSGWGRDWNKAGKLFFGGLLGATIVTPAKAIWAGAKGAVNIPLRVAYAPIEAVKVIGDVTGLKFENGSLDTKNYGAVPAVKSIFKATAGVVTAPLYPVTELSTVQGWGKKFMDGELAFDSSVAFGPSANSAPPSVSSPPAHLPRPAARPMPPAHTAASHPPTPAPSRPAPPPPTAISEDGGEEAAAA